MLDHELAKVRLQNDAAELDVGVSFEAANCKFDAMVEKWILTLNFTAAEERWRYAYKATQQGMAEKTRLTHRLIFRKLAEREA